MTTYYGAWSGKAWYYLGRELFHTPSLGLARAQAMMVSRWLAPATWEARAIGEDGLPAPSLTERQQVLFAAGRRQRIRSEAACHKCELCNKVATNWIELPRPYRVVYFCDRHEVWGTLFLGPFPLFERREL